MSYLSQFSVKNYKCLREVTLPLTPFHVLIGENDAGKSSFLEAIAAYCAAKHCVELRDCFAGVDFGQHLLGAYAKDDEAIEFVGRWTATPDPAASDWLEYGFAFRIAPGGSGSIIKEYFRQANSPAHTVRVATPSQLALGRYHKNPDDPEFKASNDPEWERNRLSLKAGSLLIQTADLYALNPSVMAMPSLRSAQKKFKMERDGFGLANLLDDILGRTPESFLDLKRDFCRYFPQFKGVALEPALGWRRQPNHGQTKEEGSKEIVFETHDGYTVSARHASDGTIIFLAYLALSYVPQPPGILLIEEPENGVYPKRLGEIIDLLRRYSAQKSDRPAPQVIITTHSPFVVSHFRPEEVSFFYRSRECSSVAEAKPLRDVRGLNEMLDRDKLYLGELWYNWDEEAWLGIPAQPSGSD